MPINFKETHFWLCNTLKKKIVNNVFSVSKLLLGNSVSNVPVKQEFPGSTDIIQVLTELPTNKF